MKNIKKPYFKKPIDSLYETMNDKGESVVRFRSNDNRERFIGTSLDPNKVPGGDTPSPSPMPSGGGMEEVTWQELKDKRDNGELNPGSLYRITDYQCTTTQEDTQSAGHQFDIVLLALSANKLAEEGWAMEHPTDVYDVTFVDSGTVSKCYIYYDGSYYNIVRVSDLIGGTIITNITIDEENKTAIIGDDEEVMMVEENLPYNYFQNSNLSAWKVWYCLDNDTARFAWAMDIQPESAIFYIDGNTPVTRYKEGDFEEGGENYYAWQSDGHNNYYTVSEEPSSGDDVYDNALDVSGNVVSYYPPTEGRGVIYRLIDEFNNDVAYDFKNIQFIRPMTDGEYDPEGEDTWVYTYTWYDLDNDIVVDISLDGGMMDGFINDYNSQKAIYELSNNVILNPNGYSIKLVGTISGYCTISGSSGLLLYNCDALEIGEVDNAIYVAGKKVLTEE